VYLVVTVIAVNIDDTEFLLADVHTAYWPMPQNCTLKSTKHRFIVYLFILHLNSHKTH